MSLHITLFTGDIADATADAVCTSTNPRLSLLMGTGASIRERGGIEVLRACEEIVAKSGRKTLPIGSAHATTAGKLPFKIAIHCVAADANHHMSSPEIIRACTLSALKVADANGCRTVAMPVFATGHSHVRFDLALRTIVDALRSAHTSVREVTIVVYDEERTAEARNLIASAS